MLTYLKGWLIIEAIGILAILSIVALIIKLEAWESKKNGYWPTNHPSDW